jgi:hypothetical protein
MIKRNTNHFLAFETTKQDAYTAFWAYLTYEMRKVWLMICVFRYPQSVCVVACFIVETSGRILITFAISGYTQVVG